MIVSRGPRYFDGRFQQTYRAATPAFGLRLGLEIQQRAIFQDEIALLPAVQEVGPFVQVALDLDPGPVLGVLVVLVDLSYRTFRHRSGSVRRVRAPANDTVCVTCLNTRTAAFREPPGAPPRTGRTILSYVYQSSFITCSRGAERPFDDDATRPGFQR